MLFEYNDFINCYSVRVGGVTRSRGGGTETTRHCTMPATVPDREKLMRFNWGKVEEHGRWLLKLFMPRVSERNGPICCYRYVGVSTCGCVGSNFVS